MTTVSPPAGCASPTPATAEASSSSSAAAAAATPPVYTYHCICTQLILASTTPLPSLPRRGNDDDSALLDRAYILPLPARPPTANADDEDSTGKQAAAAAGGEGGGAGGGGHYAILLSVQLDRRPRIVRREDGLEKRWVQRCARCACVVGYHLDWAHFAGGAGEKEGEDEGEGNSGQAGRTGWRRDVVYLLPGALVGTDEMAKGEGPQGGGGAEKGVGTK
ncbi:hypothetical protein DBV05_g768 [Lasiodiplodia theobromae]|uniref:STEEP1 domain-containing protein n=1 Tax=Lasiodiplodia theobromae TaxID=45133 RepID=A0A5N5DSM6_9PEZI|nr:hypothetical protein DBV05_g768 [Lasiodiplodia theobromae]